MYDKDSLLNTNSNFDYSAFRELASLAATSTPITPFAFTFLQAGTYVFYMSSAPASLSLVTVQPPNVKCGTAAAFVEFSSANLVTLGVVSNNTIVLSPNWDLIIGLLVGVVGIVLFMVGFIYYFRRRAWSHTMGHKPMGYREKNKKLVDPNGSKGGLFSLGNKQNQKVLPNSPEGQAELDRVQAEEDLEASPALAGVDFDDDILIPELAKKVQSNHDEIDKQLIDQKEMLSELQDTLRKEVDELKSLLKDAATDMVANSLLNPKAQRLVSDNLILTLTVSSTYNLFILL